MSGPSFGFKRSQRLLKPADYQRVLSQPEFKKSAGPMQVMARRNSMCSARLGIVVPKRLVPKANQRNRIKRLVREQFRLVAAQLAPYDIVVRCRRRTERDAAVGFELLPLLKEMTE